MTRTAIDGADDFLPPETEAERVQRTQIECAFGQGRSAGRHRLLLSENPHPLGSDRSDAWLAGYGQDIPPYPVYSVTAAGEAYRAANARTYGQGTILRPWGKDDQWAGM